MMPKLELFCHCVILFLVSTAVAGLLSLLPACGRYLDINLLKVNAQMSAVTVLSDTGSRW